MNDLVPVPLPEPFLEKTGAQAGAHASLEGARKTSWKTFAAPVGVLALVLGIGWTVAARLDDATRPEQGAAQQAAVASAASSAAEALRASQAQQQDVAALRGQLDSLKSKLEAQTQKARASEATIATLQKSLAEQKAEAAAAESQLQARIEKVRTEAQRAIDRTPVASIPTPPVKPLPSALPRPASMSPAQAAASRPTPTLGPYRAFVLREVDGGRAIVEGADGFEEVAPGDVLPGGARVEGIEQRGKKWIVLTDRGVIAPDGRWAD
jgi:uncharacterized coiled-coil protein SlyX